MTSSIEKIDKWQVALVPSIEKIDKWPEAHIRRNIANAGAGFGSAFADIFSR